MKVVRLSIRNFRGVKSATLHFGGHTLLVGANNVGKSTVCEALELALGLDRLKRFPPVEEFDFYNACYLDKTTVPPTPIPIEIEVILTDLSEALALHCVGRTESWHLEERRLLGTGEAALVDAPRIVECLRIRTVAYYDAEEDEFKANSVFCSGPTKEDGKPKDVPRALRQLFGFVYLRALRTGSRALSLERGSLLDLILQRNNVRTGIWETTIDRLRALDPPIDEGAANLAPILANVEKRLAQYIPLEGGGERATQLFVSQLSREHLRKTISFFMKAEPDQAPVPFQEMGTGTLSTLVLALLSFIAETKRDSVVFAMEEPEIAVPPHTQRRIANYLLASADQCFVTSHSPYVIERFEPEQIRILRKEAGATLIGRELRVGDAIKPKTYRRHARRAFSEAILGRGVVVGEGITERDIILAAAAKLEQADEANYPLDLSGVSVLSVDGEGGLAEFGEFFYDLGISAYALFDAKPIPQAQQERIDRAYRHACQSKYVGAEALLIAECPAKRLWELLVEVRNSGAKPGLVPAGDAQPPDDQVRTLAKTLLANDKGSGFAGRLIELCDVAELPPTVVALLKKIYAEFRRPETVPPYGPDVDEGQANASPVGEQAVPQA